MSQRAPKGNINNAIRAEGSTRYTDENLVRKEEAPQPKKRYNYPARSAQAPSGQRSEAAAEGTRAGGARAARSAKASAGQASRSYNYPGRAAQASGKASGQSPKKKNKKGHGGLIAVIIALVVAAAAAVVIFAVLPAMKENQAQSAERAAYEKKAALPVPDLPAVDSVASIGATGDILLHPSVLNGAETADGYDFTESFSAVAPYWSSLDYMIANLEVTLGGEDSGPYVGYPIFNSPDEIAAALKNAGVDMLLTANNHSYDTGEYGFLRTQEVVAKAGLEYIGTRASESDSYVLVKDIKGIKFGMVCYTYDTREYTNGDKSLNLNVMSSATENLINSFSYEHLDEFYANAQADLKSMEDQGCDVKIVFIHWGNEYQDEPSSEQETIAQKLSDFGTDVIIGGHPHVIQEFDVLEGASGNTTYCLYSMGNTISNQRKEIMDPEEPRGYTEDGLTFEISYMRFNNGRIKLQSIYILPTWVDIHYDGVFEVVPLDYNLASQTWDTDNTAEAVASYNRTLGRLGEVYPEVRKSLGLQAVPAELQ